MTRINHHALAEHVNQEEQKKENAALSNGKTTKAVLLKEDPRANHIAK